jgi:hypothetical protein
MLMGLRRIRGMTRKGQPAVATGTDALLKDASWPMRYHFSVTSRLDFGIRATP